MRILPRALQPALTWVTGKALPDETRWRLTPGVHLLASVVPMAVGVALGVFSVLASGWWLTVLPFSWLTTVHGMRKAGSMILHQCSHENFCARRRLDDALGRVIAVLLVTQEYGEYKREHIADHHSRNHMTLQDPTAQFIVHTMGCRAGMPVAAMRRAMRQTVLSPVFHSRAIWVRVRSHFTGTSVAYKVVFGASLVIETVLAACVGSWLVVAVWLVPLTVLYNTAAVLRLSCRHLFPSADSPASGRAAIADSTQGIFLGEEVPSPGGPTAVRLARWARWWARMCFVHLLFGRLFVMVGDGPCHDHHHRFPKNRDWSNYLHARRDDVVAGHPNWPAYTEVWGYWAAVDDVFDSLRRADPKLYDPARAGVPEQDHAMAPFMD